MISYTNVEIRIGRNKKSIIFQSKFCHTMPEKPTITVQLVHIEGPLKGEIEAFTDDVLQIGRHPDCQVCFPKDITIVSRIHAEIIRDGNRFKVVDQSTNGTFLNGKGVKEAVLKNGDVLMIGDGGPKVSFLAEIHSSPIDVAPPIKKNWGAPEAASDYQPPAQPQSSPLNQPAQSKAFQAQTPSETPVSKPDSNAADVRVQAPLAIQYGPTIRSFKMLPVTIGKKSDCDFIIDQTHIIDRHLQVFFFESNYWIKDLTGQGIVTVNDTPVRGQMPLQSGTRLSLSPGGPVFQFLSGGRLAEVTDLPMNVASKGKTPVPGVPFSAISNPSRRSKMPLIIFIGFLAILVIVGVLFFLATDTTDLPMLKGLKEWWFQLVEAIRGIVR